MASRKKPVPTPPVSQDSRSKYTVYVSGQPWAVFENMNPSADGKYGCADGSVRAIHLYPSALVEDQPDTRLKTELHELMHAILFEQGILKKHPESLINAIADGMASVINDPRNADLIRTRWLGDKT